MRLVTVAHGTRDALGNAVARDLTRRAGERLGLPAVAAYVELCAPLLADVMRSAEEPAVVVPLLLSTGHHVRVDLPAAAELAPGGVALGGVALGGVALGGPLGPDPLLAAAQAERLLAAGARPGQPVTMVAAGSRDPAALVDLEVAADLLSGRWGAPVRLATLAGTGPEVLDVVRPGDAVSPYLLSPGHFATRARELALSAGADVVADVIGTHGCVVELIAARAARLLTAGSVRL